MWSEVIQHAKEYFESIADTLQNADRRHITPKPTQLESLNRYIQSIRPNKCRYRNHAAQWPRGIAGGRTRPVPNHPDE
jgi:hypothetical protein